jgi:hypothetical protein
MGGDIEASSRVNYGSRFRLRIPAEPQGDVNVQPRNSRDTKNSQVSSQKSNKEKNTNGNLHNDGSGIDRDIRSKFYQDALLVRSRGLPEELQIWSTEQMRRPEITSDVELYKILKDLNSASKDWDLAAVEKGWLRLMNHIGDENDK